MNQSWWKSLAWQVYAHSPPQAEDVAKFGMAWMQAYRQRRVPLSLLRGLSRAGPTATVLAAGNLDALHYLTQHIFGEPPAQEVIGESPWWALRQELRRWQSEVNLTLAYVPRVVAGWIAGRDYLVVPEWVSQRMAVPADLKQLSRASGSLANDLRVVRRYRLTHSVSPGLTDLDEFYHRFYVPFIHQRHGPTAFTRTLRHHRVLCRRGGILWIERAQQRIAGLTYQQRGRRLRILTLGTADGDYTHVNAGAIAALYAGAFTLARERGCSVVDFGGTRAALTDGLFRYKRKWGGRLVPNRDCFHAHLVRWERWNNVVADCLARTGFVFTNGNKFNAVRVISDGQSAHAAHHDCWIAGLRQLYLINPTGWPDADPPPPQTTLIGAITTASLVKEGAC